MQTLPATRQNDAIARPETFEDMLKMAGAMQKSGFLPAAIKTPEQALAIMVAGREIGLGAMQAFRELYVVNGQVGMSTRLIAALYRQNGGTYTFAARNSEVCEVALHLPDGTTVTHKLTRKEADDAGFTKQKNKDNEWEIKHNWKASAAQMLGNNALKQAIRIWYPECLLQALGVADAADLPVDPEMAPLAEDVKGSPANVVEAVVTEIPQDGPPINLPADVQMIVEGLRDMAASKGHLTAKATGKPWSETPATDGQRQMLARNMTEALGEMATDQLRHDICGIVFPGAAQGMNMAQTGALIDWLVEKDADGKFNLKAKAVDQIMLLAGVATARGQEMPF